MGSEQQDVQLRHFATGLFALLSALLIGVGWLVVEVRDTRAVAGATKDHLLLTPIGVTHAKVTEMTKVCYETDVPCEPFAIHVKATAPTAAEAMAAFKKAIAEAEALTASRGE